MVGPTGSRTLYVWGPSYDQEKRSTLKALDITVSARTCAKLGGLAFLASVGCRGEFNAVVREATLSRILVPSSGPTSAHRFRRMPVRANNEKHHKGTVVIRSLDGDMAVSMASLVN